MFRGVTRMKIAPLSRGMEETPLKKIGWFFPSIFGGFRHTIFSFSDFVAHGGL